MNAVRAIDVSESRPALALELPEQTSFDEWVAIGRRLCLTSQALNWQIGDWWAFGDHRYGERAKAAAEGLFGREFQTLMNLASVARAIEPSRRGEVLSWTHYREVAALPAEKREPLLEKAEREHLSTRDLRREVQALKAANDPEAGKTREEPRPSKPITPQSYTAELTKAYEMVIEFAEALEQERKLTRREQDLLTVALTYVQDARSGHRPCPDDFDVIFVEKGRLACEEWYAASRVSVNRWLIERGKKRLIDQRAAFVRFQREKAHQVAVAQGEPQSSEPINEAQYALASHAAEFLRVSRYGGWRVSPAGDSTWYVGTVRKTSDELIAMAERQGFDSLAVSQSLQALSGEGVEG